MSRSTTLAGGSGATLLSCSKHRQHYKLLRASLRESSSRSKPPPFLSLTTQTQPLQLPDAIVISSPQQQHIMPRSSRRHLSL